MRKKRSIALALVLTLSLGAVTALAEESLLADPEDPAETVTETETAVTQDSPAAEEAADTENQIVVEVSDPDGGYETDQPVLPDAAGTLSFANLEERVRSNNLTVLALQETIEAVKATDYKKLQSDLQDQLDELQTMTDGIEALLPYLSTTVSIPVVSYDAGAQSLDIDAAATTSVSASVTANNSLTSLLGSFQLATLESSIDSLNDAIADLKSGKTQQTAEDGILQMENGQDQYVVAAESLYITVLELQNTKAGLQRSLDAMDRTLQEMELRYSMGQVSALQLQQVKSGRVQLQSGLDTLCNSMESAVVQLELMVGADVTGQLTVSEVADVTDAQVNDVHYETDWELVREKSYDLHAAKATLDDAEADYKDAVKQYGKSTYQRKAAEHQWQAAQYTYQATVQSLEAKFRTVCNAVADYQQIVRAKESALALQQSTLRSMELKYQQGTISQNDYLAAQDDLASAQNDVTTAKHDLFTAFRTYQWAVRYGVLN